MIHDFTDLEVWQAAHRLVISIYELVRAFPEYERYGLGDQLRRAAVSVTSNIAEGFGRQTMREKLQFYYMASGSLTEVRNQLYIARDVGYINTGLSAEMVSSTQEVHMLLHGLIRASKTRINHPTSII